MKHRKTIFGAVLGTSLEYYDAMLYAFLATLLAPLYFPSDNAALSLLASLGTFAAGYLIRPLGGLFFGRLGDKIGRTKALAYAIAFMTLPTLCMSLIPTYATWGVWAPICLVLCRLLQGFCVAGEFAGAAVLIAEHAPEKRQGFFGSWLIVAVTLGSLLGIVAGLIFTMDGMPAWGFRIPFALGGVIGIVGYFYRRNLHESPAFLDLVKRNALSKAPLRTVLRQEGQGIFRTVGIASCNMVSFYAGTLHVNIMLKTELGYGTKDLLMRSAMAMICWSLCLPLWGKVSDWFGRERLMAVSAVATLALSPLLFYMISVSPTFNNILLFQVAFCLLNTAYMAPANSVYSTFFRTENRYTGIAFGYALGGAIFGGTTPFMLSWLKLISGSGFTPCLYVIAINAFGLWALKPKLKAPNFQENFS